MTTPSDSSATLATMTGVAMAQDEDPGLVLTNIQMVATVLCRNLKNVREEMGAHHDYGMFRSAVDILNWHAFSGPTFEAMQGLDAVCPMGHEMETLKTSGGNCGRCGRAVPNGWFVAQCQTCVWWICKGCGSSPS